MGKSFGKARLGEMLVSDGAITEEQLNTALMLQKQKKDRIGNLLKKMGYATESDIIRVLGKQMGIKHMSLSNVVIDQSIVEKVPELIARKYQVMPLYAGGNLITLGMLDPLDIFAIDKVSELTGMEVEPVVCKEYDIMQAYNLHYLNKGRIADGTKQNSDESSGDVHDPNTEPPAIKLVDKMFSEAVLAGASDIHVEPEEDEMRIRYRIDGVLHEVNTSNKNLYPSVISRIKVMGDMDISEKRVPQDGRCMVSIAGKQIDMRISTLPTIFGEKIVVRLLDRENVLVGLNKLGFEPNVLTTLETQVRRPYGMVLVAGPTGSGKTSTLYAVLNTINSMEKNIITVEDPVEYQLRIVNQLQVNNKVGVNFAQGLRSIMRQDPDVIMVGEIRDIETASMSIQAALTGHLLLSTIHSNNTVGTVARLINMGVEPFLIATSLNCVVAQRLVRKICTKCKVEFTYSGKFSGEDMFYSGKSYKGEGCEECRGTGYVGRIGIFEYLEVDDSIRNLIYNNADSDEMFARARKNGMKTLRESALEKVNEGVTTLEETFRVTVDS